MRHLGLNRMRTKADLIEANELTPDVAEAVFSRIHPLAHREDGTPLYLESAVDRAIEMVAGLQLPSAVIGPLLTTKQAARYLAVSERQLQYEVARSKVTSVRFGKSCIRFAQEDLDDYVNRHRTAAQAVRSI